MTGRCYFCSAGEHHECYSLTCTCCGERNRKHQAGVDELEAAIRKPLAAKPKPITGGEYFRFMNPGVSDEYDADEEML